MKCTWENNSECVKKYLMGIGLFFLSVLGMSVLIKFISLILSIFSNDPYLNTSIVVIATILTLMAYYKSYCSKSYRSCCHGEELKKESDDSPKKSTASKQE